MDAIDSCGADPGSQRVEAEVAAVARVRGPVSDQRMASGSGVQGSDEGETSWQASA
jgi:hypothetical protein